ncbi:protein SIX6OS1 [Melozone crissalis]|uniref:protein SIX6OS1 n=1 Tax=Melozone crissalis TaxID=40204 RepID=UPI0023D9FC30|nr:protein SIX6OS1 [Melozone crissalis]
MSGKVSISLDKILVKFAYQIEKNHSAKEHVDHQINSYTAEITEKKNEIAWLEANIKKSNEAIADLQKHNENSKRRCDVWKSTYVILKKHGEYLNKEMKALEEATETERKIYEDSITQCRMNLEEHHKKYTETALAQKYYQIKEEVEEIQKGVLKCLEKYKWKEDACLDILEAVPFASINNWAVHIASMRKKIQETLQLAEAAAQETIKLEKEAEELQMKFDCLTKSIKETKEDQNKSEKIEGKNQKSLEKPELFKERVFEERERPSLPKGKHQLFKTLHVPCIPQKFVQSVQSFRFSKQRPETGKEEKEKSVELSVATSSSSNLAKNLSQQARRPNMLMKKQMSTWTVCMYLNIQNLDCEEGTSKSPAFFSHMNFTQKSPGFNLFDSSLFGAQNSSDETEENYPMGNLNSLSSHEDIGSFFGKPENEDAFAFPSPSESTSHAFGDGKDDVSFSFAFGQDQRSPQSPSMKGFHSSTQNTKPFTFF